MVAYLEDLASTATDLELLLVRRDLLVCTILWQTMSRGINAGHGTFRLANVRFPDGELPPQILYLTGLSPDESLLLCLSAVPTSLSVYVLSK